MSSVRSRSRVCPHCDRVQSPRNRLCSGCGEELLAATATGRVRLPGCWQRALDAAPPIGHPRWLLQAGLLGVMAWTTWGYVASGLGRSQHAISLPHQLLEAANLVFHEAGHWILAVVGVDLLTIAGGSLLQLAVPAICAAAFLSRHPDPFAAAFATWWTGQSAVNLAPYVADARAQQLILLGGVTGRDRPGYHDWNNLLRRLGLLEWDGLLGGGLHWAGLGTMAAALLISLLVLRAQAQKPHVGDKDSSFAAVNRSRPPDASEGRGPSGSGSAGAACG